MTARRYTLTLLVVAVGLGTALMVFMRSQEFGPTGVEPPPPPLQAPRVESTLRALRLITVEITATVASESEDRSWRGDAQARVEAPARYYFGVDLSRLGDGEGSFGRDPLTGGYRLRVPAPKRLAVEVLGTEERPSVRVGGTRLRGVAGEYQLGLARAALHSRALALHLDDEQRRSVDRMTREQLTALVRALIGPEVDVGVEFMPEPGEVIASPGAQDAP